MSTTIGTIRAGLARAQEGIASLRLMRAKGTAEPTAGERLSSLRDEAEILADRLALAEAEEAERQRAEVEAAAIARAQARADAINDFTGRKEALDAEIMATMDRLARVLAQVPDMATALGRLDTDAAGPFRIEAGNLFARYYVQEIGRMVASALPDVVTVPQSRVHPWPHGSEDWARVQRRLLFERIQPDAGAS